MLAYVIKSYDQLYQMPLISPEICQLEYYLYPFFYDSVHHFKRCIFSGMFKSKAILVRTETTTFIKMR